MLKIQEIREIIKLIDQSSIEEFTYEIDDAKIKLKKNKQTEVVPVQVKEVKEEVVTPKVEVTETKIEQPAPQPAKQEVEAAPQTQYDDSVKEIVSPMVGTFYAASSPEADAYVKVGDQVNEETIVCIVEAMKLFNEIEAEVTGEIVEVLVKDGQLVEYGQPLFLVKTK